GVLDLVKKIGAIPGVRDFAMTTNGILLPQMADDLKAAGLKRLNISLDTLNAEKYKKVTRWGKLEDALGGIKAAKNAGFTPLKINVVLIKGFNDDEIESFVDMTREEPIEIRFIELMPLGDSTDYAASQYLSNDVVLERISMLKQVEDKVQSGPAKRYQLPGAKGTVGLINPISHLFCSDCNRIRVTTDGKIKPCLHSDREIDILQLKKEGLSDVEILKQAIEAKPERHHIDENQTIKNRNMNEIGG
ncbi:MAG: radical SAM protein, partial [Eubacterium sp.]